LRSIESTVPFATRQNVSRLRLTTGRKGITEVSHPRDAGLIG
jgi:hypothetical protein